MLADGTGIEHQLTLRETNFMPELEAGSAEADTEDIPAVPSVSFLEEDRSSVRLSLGISQLL